MRIIRLQPLIQNEETREFSMQNCTVVIDGHNYFYDAYNESKQLSTIFGCEANEYARYLKNRFIMFKKANVKCYIVFKGGNTDINKKIDKVKNTTFANETNNEYVLRLVNNEICKQVLDEMQIDYSICVAEAKEECSALAHKLRCPIISFDVEYCFKYVPYISRYTITFNKSTNSIQCRLYKLQDFLQNHSLTEEKAAIFATLSDKTLFTPNFFDSLLITWEVSDTNVYGQHKKLILWLSENSTDKVKEDIDKTLLNDDNKNTFWGNVEKLIKGMQPEVPGIVGNCLVDSQLTISCQDPRWFEKGVATKTIPIPYINLYKWKIIQGACAVETKTSDDSILLSIDIIKYAYNLLTDFKMDKLSLIYINEGTFTEINTAETNVTKPSYSCKESVFENGWSDIKSLKLFEHFLNENHINSDVLNKLPVEATVLFAALAYFTRQKRSKEVMVTKEVYAVLVSYALLNVLFDTEGSYRKTKYKIKEEDCQQVINATKKYFKCGEMEALNIFDGNLLNNLIELQYCLLHMNYLNTLCGSPYKATKYGRAYNGTFVYKLLYDMQEHDADVFIKNMFKQAPSVFKFINYIIKTYQELL